VGLADYLRQPVMRRSKLPHRLIAKFGMLFDKHALIGSQATGLCDQRLRDGEQADVMH
jgi:hypothetical protein